MVRAVVQSPVRCLAFLALAACSTPPTITGVDPSEGVAGTEFKVVGTNFAPDVSVSLAPESGDPLPLTLTDANAVVLSTAAPATAPAGTYAVVVTQGGIEVRVSGGFTVSPPVVDLPCGNLYTANTVVSLATREAVVDRFYRDERRETVRVPLDDVVAVDFERVAVDGGLCSVVYLRQKNGERVRFQDDIEVDLKARAYKLGQDLGKKVEITREDPAPAPTTPPGDNAPTDKAE